MLAVAKNYDILCYHLKVVHKNLNGPIRAKVEMFLQGVRADLLNNESNFKHIIEAKLSDILDLRLSALKWLMEENKKPFERLDNEAYPYFEKMMEDDKLSVLADNILFAIRSNKKVVDALLVEFKEEDFGDHIVSNIPEISYEQLNASIYFAIPDNKRAKAMLEWIDCSLIIEYVLCAAALIYDEDLSVSLEKIQQLSTIIVNASQTYAAISFEIGILTSRKKESFMSRSVEDVNFLAEQKRIADAGINMFANNWKD